MTSGVYSQKLSTNKEDSRSITSVQRDSIFIKIKRGKVNEEKVKVLKKALADCGSTKQVYKKIIEISKDKADSLDLIIMKQEDLAETVKQISDLKLKEQKKKTTKSFFKGGVAGIMLTILVATAAVIL